MAAKIPYDEVWAPGGKAMTLFTNVPVAIGGHDVRVGAYTLFVIPSQKQWKVVVSKNMDTSARYDEEDNLVRLPMNSGQLDQPESQFSIFCAHVASQQCCMRLDLEQARAWSSSSRSKTPTFALRHFSTATQR